MPARVPEIDEVIARSRRIVSNLDGVAFHEAPFRLVFVCEGAAFELAVTRITRFALLVSAALGTLVAVRAAPWPLGLVVLAWLGGVATARLVARRRRAQHGRVLVDFETDEVFAETRLGARVRAPLGGARVRVVAATDALAPLWLWLVLADGRALRLAKSDDAGLAPVLTHFRRYGVAVERDA